jgi:hypothetical protein
MIEAQERQRMYSGEKETPLEVGDKVWLSTRNLNEFRPSKKLNSKRTGPYTFSKIINKNTSTLDVLSTIRFQKVFRVSLFYCYTPPVVGQLSSKPHPMMVEEREECEVDCILGSRRCNRKLPYLIQAACYSHIRRSCKPAVQPQNAQDLVDKVNRECPDLIRT